jgi:hypothetical protein
VHSDVPVGPLRSQKLGKPGDQIPPEALVPAVNGDAGRLIDDEQAAVEVKDAPRADRTYSEVESHVGPYRGLKTAA